MEDEVDEVEEVEEEEEVDDEKFNYFKFTKLSFFFFIETHSRFSNRETLLILKTIIIIIFYF